MATTQLQLSDEVALASSSMNQMYPEIPDLAQVTCRVLNTTDPSQFFRQTLTQLDEKDFLCSYKTHCLALCLCCDFLACDCQVRPFIFICSRQMTKWYKKARYIYSSHGNTDRNFVKKFLIGNHSMSLVLRGIPKKSYGLLSQFFVQTW